jgi:DNA-binding PadR family transcriptional regulator
MAKRRRGYLFDLDARVLAEASRIHREGGTEFYGLQVANRLGIEKIHVYRSLRRLTALELVDRWWEDQDRATAEGRPRRRLYQLTRHGHDAVLHALMHARVFGRSRPRDSNSDRRL